MSKSERIRPEETERVAMSDAGVLHFYDRLLQAKPKLLPYTDNPSAIDACVFALSRQLQQPGMDKLLVCSWPSVLGGVIRTLQTGLTVGVTCFVLPFWNDQRRRFEATWIAHYKGLMELAYDTGRVASIVSHVVLDDEKFEVHGGSDNRIIHIRRPFSNAAIVGAYAVARMVPVGIVDTVLSRADIDAVRRDYSKRWSVAKVPELPDWYAKKCAIRNLCTGGLPMSRAMRLAHHYDSGGALLTAAEAAQVPEDAMPAASMPAASMPAAAPAALPVGMPAPSPRPSRAVLSPVPATSTDYGWPVDVRGGR